MPVGYLITVGLVAAGMLLAVVPLRRPGTPGIVSWGLSAVVNESPFVAFYYVVAATLLALGQGDLGTPVGLAGLAVAGLTAIGFPIIVRRGFLARPAVERALDTGLGRGWRGQFDSAAAARLRRRLPWARILLAPIPIFSRGVEQNEEHPLRRRRQEQPARRLPIPFTPLAGTDAHPSPWRVLRHRPQELRGAAAAAPPREQRLGLSSAPTTACARPPRSPTI